MALSLSSALGKWGIGGCSLFRGRAPFETLKFELIIRCMFIACVEELFSLFFSVLY